MTLTARTPYDANGHATVHAGELVILELSIESRGDGGAFAADDLSDRVFYQRILDRRGHILAEAAVAFVAGEEGQVIRFTLTGDQVAALLPAGRLYVDLSHVIAEVVEGGRDYLFEPLRFSVRLADDPSAPPPAPGPPAEAAPIARFVIRRQGGHERLVVRNSGSRGKPGPPGDGAGDPGDLVAIFESHLI